MLCLPLKFISGHLFNLTTSWATYSVEFTTSGFSGTVNDGRFRFWFTNLADAGDTYYFDDVVLEEVAGGSPTDTPQPTATQPGPTSTNTPQPTATSPGGSVVQIVAGGQTGEESMELLINDQLVYSVNNVSTILTTYSYTHSGAVNASQVKVRLPDGSVLPGGGDRDLRVDKILIDGQTYETEASTTYSTGSWHAASSSCADHYAQTEWLSCTGYFHYGQAGPTATPTPQPPPHIQRTTYSVGGILGAVRVREVAPNGTELADDIYFPLTDRQGSVVAVSDASGNMVGDVIRYEPFGDYRGTAPGSSVTAVTDRGYTGHHENRDVGLTFMQARYYIPEIGLFASADTIVPDYTNPQSLNRYSYVLNSPINATDPTGHMPSDGCDLEGCSLPAGFDAADTWIDDSGGYVYGDPVLLNAFPGDFTWSEAGFTALGLFGLSSIPTIAAAALPPVIEIAGAACADGHCTNEIQGLYRQVNFIRQRLAYERAVKKILPEAQRRLVDGQSAEIVARWAHNTRRGLGIKYKDMMPADALEVVYTRNLQKYGDRLGPTVKYFRDRNYSWEEIIESAARPGGQDILKQLFDMIKSR